MQELQKELISKMQIYHPSSDFSLVEKAFNFVYKAQSEKINDESKFFVNNSLKVALILADIYSDIETIVASILYNSVEFANHTCREIEFFFGIEIANLVEGVMKLKSLKYVPKEDQIENYRQLFFTMSNDIRVILIKIADCLQTLYTLGEQSCERQQYVSQEILDIYAPLTHRLGISKIKHQLEDLSLRYLKPEVYYDLAEQIKHKLSERQEIVNSVVSEIQNRLKNEKIDAKILGRAKHFFSIYKKMLLQDKTLEEIYDLLAVRIIVNTKQECYAVLSIVHELYEPVTKRIKDYIAVKKPNNYQSIHTTVQTMFDSLLEIQIRTHEMDRVAEYGFAAHWKYKQNQGGVQEAAKSSEQKIAWLRQVIEWQMGISNNKPANPIKSDFSIYTDYIYCLTPQSDVITLKNGSSPIDFAYAIHSEVGHKMIGAKVNGKMVSFNHVLLTGDLVEIITSKKSKGPRLDWLKITKTSEAKNKINHWFKNSQECKKKL